jgi:hypothetical protein
MNKLFLLGMFLMFACQDQEDVNEHLLVAQGGNTVSCDYTQAFGNAQHTGATCSPVNGMRLVASVVQDDHAIDAADQMGFYADHAGAPLTGGDLVIVPVKTGFTSIFDQTTSSYSVQALRWFPSADDPSAVLTPIWTASSTWRPVDALLGKTGLGTFTNGYVMGFYPALSTSSDSLYMPGISGQLIRVSLTTGVVTTTVDPLLGTSLSKDSRTATVSGLTVDDAGNVYYTVTAFHATSNSNGAQPRGSWLVRVRPDNTSTITPWSSIASPSVGVPSATSLCPREFGIGGTKPPTSSATPPPMFGCGAQRPAFNSPVTIDPANGRLLVYTLANNAPNAAFIVEVNPATMTPTRALDTQGHILNGCGVRLDINLPECQVITDGGATHIGFDPLINLPTPLEGQDLVDSAITVAPNGDRTICGYDSGFSFGGDYDARGACVSFTRAGAFQSTNLDFGWEVTPSVWPHDGTFSYIQDRNFYSHVFEDGTGIATARYSPTGQTEAVGDINIDFDAAAVDFLDANVLVDTYGGHYAVNGDGHLYHFNAAGQLLETLALTEDDGSVIQLETLSGRHAWGRGGRLYISWRGRVWVIAGTGELPAQAPHLAPPSARVRSGFQRKLAGLRGAVSPVPSIVQ